MALNRVAIIGSCITRDLWPVRGGAAGDLLYISRTSLPSLLATPLPVRIAAKAPAPLGPHQHRAVAADLRKMALDELLRFRPTHIIFDFIDERFDLLAAAGSIVTRSWELEVSGYRNQKALRGARRIPRLSPECDRLWAEAAGEFAALIRATPLASAKLILHVSRWASEQRAASGQVRPIQDCEVLAGEPADIDAHNDLLDRYEAQFLQAMPPMERIDPAAFRIADADHRWGLSPFHFVPEYYAEVWRRLAELGVSPPAGELRLAQCSSGVSPSRTRSGKPAI